MILMNNKMLDLIKKQAIGNLRLNKKLSKILDAGIECTEGCHFLQYFYQVNQQYSLNNFEDHTAYECFINGFHIEDYCTNDIVQHAFIFAKKLAIMLNGKCKFKIIISTNNRKCCHVTFHSFHKDEIEWVAVEHLDSYSECLAIFYNTHDN